jgi:hypothetical protein
MDEEEALQVVRMMRPELVIPCHYNCPAFFTKRFNPADERMFKEEVEKINIKCTVLHAGESFTLVKGGEYGKRNCTKPEPGIRAGRSKKIRSRLAAPIGHPGSVSLS